MVQTFENGQAHFKILQQSLRDFGRVCAPFKGQANIDLYVVGYRRDV